MLDYPAYRAASRRNYFHQDPILGDLLQRHLPERWREWTTERLEQVGHVAATRWADLAITANENVPKLRPLNRWGERIDEVEVHPAYDQLAREAYEAGVVWPRFSTEALGEKSPWTVVMALGYVAAQAEQGLFCPVCLTSGTAWLLERFADPALRDRYLPHVASSRYESLYEGAMFLTERAGGSDVGANTTQARCEDGQWRLYGDKWFASNAGRAKAMMVLARPEGAPAGTRGLGLFMVPWSKPDGERNAIRIQRMKDKLGTRSMPSGEITFEGALAFPVGPVESGFAEMVEMLSLSRIYNAVGSVSNMRRVINEVSAYAHARSAFGSPIDRYPLMRTQLIDWSVEQEAGLRAAFEAIHLLDKADAGTATPREQLLLRLLTPILKYYTARQSVDCASWGTEAFGGNGYIEEWPIARFLRDAQVLTIWEGTTNILVLDALRSFAKENTGPAFCAELGERLARDHGPTLAPWRDKLIRESADLEQQLMALAKLDDAARTLHAKAWCDRALQLYQAVLLLESAAQGVAADQGRAVLVLGHFMRRHFAPDGWREKMAGLDPALGFEAIVRNQPIGAQAAVAALRGTAPVSSS